MKGMIGKVARDALGIARVIGPATAMKWMFFILANWRRVLSSRNLQAADAAMGSGPFVVRYSDAVSFKICGSSAFSGIREMYVRDTYLHRGMLDIKVVLDLGANIGNFTNLALAHGPSVRVVAVEPSRALQESMGKSIGLNEGFAGRVTRIRAILGREGSGQLDLSSDPDYLGARWLSERELIAEVGLTRIDLMKCDIEGGEFALLHPSRALLEMTRKIAIEIHAFSGDVNGFIEMLRGLGFSVLHIQRDPDRSATVSAERRQSAPAAEG